MRSVPKTGSGRVDGCVVVFTRASDGECAHLGVGASEQGRARGALGNASALSPRVASAPNPPLFLSPKKKTSLPKRSFYAQRTPSFTETAPHPQQQIVRRDRSKTPPAHALTPPPPHVPVLAGVAICLKNPNGRYYSRGLETFEVGRSEAFQTIDSTTSCADADGTGAIHPQNARHRTHEDAHLSHHRAR